MLVNVKIDGTDITVPIQVFKGSIVFVRGGDGQGRVSVGDHIFGVGETIPCTPLVGSEPFDDSRDIEVGQILSIMLPDSATQQPVQIGEVTTGSDRDRSVPPLADPWDGHPPFFSQ